MAGGASVGGCGGVSHTCVGSAWATGSTIWVGAGSATGAGVGVATGGAAGGGVWGGGVGADVRVPHWVQNVAPAGIADPHVAQVWSVTGFSSGTQV